MTGSRQDKEKEGTTEICSRPGGYVYQPLLPEHIRLLSIAGGLEELHILHTSIYTAPNYNAVSYSWDGQWRNHSLGVDGYNLNIIGSLRSALPHLIDRATTLFLWIDAICIDQGNDEEKAVQIPLMQQIYSKTQRCLVWLGEKTPEAEFAIDAIPRISQQLKICDASRIWETEGIGPRSSEALTSSLWRGIVDLFSRSWFTRVWTFQESVLADNVVFLCSSKILAFEDIAPLALPLLHHLTSLQVSFQHAELGERRPHVGFLKLFRISDLKSRSREARSALNTLKLLYFTRTWSTSNRLDKIYGVLGLATSSLQSYLAVNYSNTTTQVSRQVAQWYTLFGEDLFLLNLASSFKDHEDGLPSWMPDLSQLGAHWCIGVIWPRFRTGIDKPFAKPSSSIFQDELYVRGIAVDRITHVVSYIHQPSTRQAEKCKNILDWEEACLTVSKSVFGEVASDSVPDAHWMTIISGICDDHLKANRSEYDLLKYFLTTSSTGDCLSPELEIRNQDLAVQIRRLSQVTRIGRFFCTLDGRIGLGPISTLPGDRICIFYNGFTPFIIRPRPETSVRYQLVGDSYIYGLMHGEVFTSEIQETDETFILV